MSRLSQGFIGEAKPEGCGTVKAFNEAKNYNGPYP